MRQIADDAPKPTRIGQCPMRVGLIKIESLDMRTAEQDGDHCRIKGCKQRERSLNSQRIFTFYIGRQKWLPNYTHTA